MHAARASAPDSPGSATTKARTSAGSPEPPTGGQPAPRARLAKAYFEADPSAVGAARRLVRGFLEGDARTEDAELIVSELATNAVRHAESPFSVTLVVEERLRIEVSDKLELLPLPKASSPDAVGARGLQIVEALACAWGTWLDPEGGKVVWAEL